VPVLETETETETETGPLGTCGADAVSNPAGGIGMGFDLWDALGVSPRTGVLAVLGALAMAALLAAHAFWRNRAASRATRSFSLSDRS
jgi:hypothetical protein